MQVCGEHPFLDLDDLSKEKLDYSRTYRNIVKGSYVYPDGLIVSEGLQDLLGRIFQVEPSRRITLDGIFKHPWFQTDLPAPAAKRDYGVNEVFELESDIRAMVRSANPDFKWR